MNKKHLYLIAGRSASGKDTITAELCRKFGWRKVVSFTDTPMRTDQRNGIEHWFLQKDEFDNLLKENHILAYTQIGEYRYCATVESIEEDIRFYIIDPVGIKFLRENYADQIDMTVIFVYVPKETCLMRMERRGNFDAEARFKGEDEMFTDFEQRGDWDFCIDNNGTLEEAVNKAAKFIEGIEKCRKNNENVA